MKYVQLRLHSPTQSFSKLHEALGSCDAAGLTQLRLGGISPSGDRTYVFSVEGDLEAILATLQAADGVYDTECLDRRDGYALLYASSETTALERRLQSILTSDSLVTGVPIDLHPDGSTVLRVIGDAADLGTAVERVRENVPVTVERVAEYDRRSAWITASLTDRQLDAVETAIEIGYYDVPREATHEDVAAELGCAPSTASEHLRKAESTLIRNVFQPDLW